MQCSESDLYLNNMKFLYGSMWTFVEGQHCGREIKLLLSMPAAPVAGIWEVNQRLQDRFFSLPLWNFVIHVHKISIFKGIFIF